MQTLYYTRVHLVVLQASFLSETNVYLGYTCFFVRPSWVRHRDEPPNIILTPEMDFCRPKISGIRGIALVSVTLVKI